MRVSSSNIIYGVIKEINIGDVMATIRIQFGESIVDSVVPKDVLEDMRIMVGDQVTAMIESEPVTIETRK